MFYARLKGTTSNIEKIIEHVELQKYKQFMSKNLSGGCKRRLSLAIALAGDPELLILDEPTTGLDPEHRRQVWDILSKQSSNIKGGILLTTHSMQEAEVLCQRIGILDHGSLRCLASPIRLKTLYGLGFQIVISPASEEVSGQIKQLFTAIPSSKLVGEFKNLLEFRISLDIGTSTILKIIQENKHLIQHFSISPSSLEEVFLNLVINHD